MSRFLRFAVEGALSGAASPKEYLVGIEVFDRSGSGLRKILQRIGFLP